MLVIGGKPSGRFTEQHDVFFGVAEKLKDLVPALYKFWPALEGKMHIDSWRKVSQVEGYQINVVPRESNPNKSEYKLFFVNLGGYKPNDMEEYHYKKMVVAKDLAEATRIAKQSVFWKHHDSSHIDDKYGIDVDDIYEVEDLLDSDFKSKFQFHCVEGGGEEDELHVGYLKISKLIAQK